MEEDRQALLIIQVLPVEMLALRDMNSVMMEIVVMVMAVLVVVNLNTVQYVEIIE